MGISRLDIYEISTKLAVQVGEKVMSKEVCAAGSTGLSMNNALSLLGIVALLIILTGIAQADDLSRYRQDPANTGNTNECFSDDLELLWRYNTSDTVWEVSISSDGEYIAAGCFDDTVYFFNREGKLLWQYKTGTIVKSVSISSDGEYIAVGSASHSYISDEYGEAKVYLFNRAGKLLWSYEPDGPSVDKVSISSDGNYIVAGIDGYPSKLYVFNKKGRLLWSREDIDPDDTSISSDGSYVVTSCCDQEVWGVCLFNKDGKLLWRYEVYGGGSVSVSADGSYVTAGSDGKVYFFNRAGKLLWSYQHPEQREKYLFSIDVDAELEEDLKKGIFTERLKNIFKTKGIPLDENIISAIKNNWDTGEYSIQKEKGKIDFYRRYSGMYIYYTWISSDGNYVAAKTRGKLYFFNKDGELLWSFQTEGDPGSIWRGVSISSDGSYVVVGNYGDDHHYDGNLYFFNRNGGLLGEYKTNTSVESASISSDGSYVAVGTFNMVYCFTTNVPRVPAAKLVITSPLETTAEDIFYVGDTLTAKFAITNRGVKSVTFDVLVVGGRDPSGEVVDFDETSDVTLNLGDSYDYVGYLTLPNKPGTYHFFCAYQTPDGNWNANIEVEIDGKIVEDFCEAKKYRERDIIVFEKTYISPAPPPVIWEEIHGPWKDKRSEISQIAVHQNNPEVVYAAVKYYHYHWGYEGDELYKSTNGGSSWNLINLGLPRLTLSEYYWPISAIAIATSNPDIIYVGTSDINPYSSPVPSAKGIYKSTDGGTEWTSVGGPYTGKWIFKTYCSISSIVVDPIDPNTAYVGTVGGGIWRTTNGGESWDNIWDEPVNKETFLDVNAIAISPANPDTIYAVAYNFNSLTVMGWSGILIPNRLIKSEDGGDTWERLTFGILTAAPKIDDIAVDSENADIVYVITEHYKVYKSTDGGKNWDDASGTDGGDPLPYVSRPWSIGKSGSIAMHSDYSNVIYASGEWGFKSVYVSPNSGENWFPIEDLNDKHVKEIVLASNADSRVIYAAAIEGLFKVDISEAALELVAPVVTPTPEPTNVNAQSKITWYDQEGMQIAKSQNKPTMIFFYSDRCPASKKQKDVFADTWVIDMSKNFVPIVGSRGLDRQYGIRYVPTIVFTNSHGMAVHRIVGYRDADTLVNEMQYALMLSTTLDVPFFSQRDPAWRDKKLDHSTYSFGEYGCALISAAMVAKYFGYDTDPNKLNTSLTAVGGLDTSGIIYWKKVEEVSDGKVAWIDSVGASWSRIDQELSSENPVISSVNCPLGTHFIVFVGKSGDEHYFLDPYDKKSNIREWPNGAHGVYTLKNLKIYHRIPTTLVS